MRPSRSTCGSGSTYARLLDRISHKSTYFPETIWLTSEAGIEGKPGPITNDWCRIGPEGNDVVSKETTGRAEADEVLVLNDTSDALGGAKVATKGTPKAGIPGLEDAAREE